MCLRVLSVLRLPFLNTLNDRTFSEERTLLYLRRGSNTRSTEHERVHHRCRSSFCSVATDKSNVFNKDKTTEHNVKSTDHKDKYTEHNVDITDNNDVSDNRPLR